MGYSMRMGMGLGAMMQKGGGGGPIDWTIAADADGTKYVRIQCADEGQTLTVTGGAEIKLESGGTWGTSIDVPAGETNRNIYFRGNGTGGILTIPKPENVTYLFMSYPGSSISGSINGMALTYLYLSGTSSYITGSITGMKLKTLYLNATGSYITGSINGMALTYIYLLATGNSITGSVTGMALTFLVLSNAGNGITGTPAQIGTPLLTFRVDNGTSYDYPWTEQAFGGTKQTWASATMNIDSIADAPTPAEFDEWLLGLASVSNAGTESLTLKNTPYATEADDIAAGGDGTNSLEYAGLIGEGSGYYRMTNDLGYTLILGE